MKVYIVTGWASAFQVTINIFANAEMAISESQRRRTRGEQSVDVVESWVQGMPVVEESLTTETSGHLKENAP